MMTLGSRTAITAALALWFSSTAKSDTFQIYATAGLAPASACGAEMSSTPVSFENQTCVGPAGPVSTGSAVTVSAKSGNAYLGAAISGFSSFYASTVGVNFDMELN